MNEAASPTDELFFANASAAARLGLILRCLFAALFKCDAACTQDHNLRLFGVEFQNASLDSALRSLFSLTHRDGPMRRVFFINADCLNIAYRHRRYQYEVHSADLVLPDGSGVRLAAKWLGSALKDNLNGTDLFPHICQRAVVEGKRLYFLGGAPGIAARAAAAAKSAHPGLQIVGTQHGYFDDVEPVIAAINQSQADILLVGMGAPRQETWLTEHAESLAVSVGIGVGGLFDFVSNDVSRAPLWVREMGCEWVWRIAQQPADKWRRYLLGNPLFLFRVLKQRLNLGPHSCAPLCEPDEWFEHTPATVYRRLRTKMRLTRWRYGLLIQSLLKRTFDLVVAAGALLLAAPLMLILAALVKTTSKGPTFFAQTRVGLRGRHFKMLKFRSMCIDAEAKLAALQSNNESQGGVLFKIKNDPRITPVGRWMRRFSMDELPQLINVLLGDMSVVGPRPALPNEVDLYSANDLKRLQSKPGITCWWQVSGRSNLPFKEQVQLDIRYLKNQSFLEDMRLLVRTVPAVVTGKGAS